MTQEQLDEILLLHQKYLASEEGGQQADISFVDLDNLYLKTTELDEIIAYGTNFSKQNLTGTSFRGAKLDGACFKDCYLEGCNFLGAILRKADLRNCVIKQTRFDLADLSFANVSYSTVSDITAGNADLAFLEDAEQTFVTQIPDVTLEAEPIEKLL